MDFDEPSAALAAPPLLGGPCVDAARHCAEWSTEGYCSSASPFRAYMLLNCNATCGLCLLDGANARGSTGTETEDAASASPSRYVIIVPIAMVVLLVVGWAAGVAYMRRHRTTDDASASVAGMQSNCDEEHSVYAAPRYYTKSSASTMSEVGRRSGAAGQSQRMTFSEVASVAGAVLKAQSQLSGSPTPSESTRTSSVPQMSWDQQQMAYGTASPAVPPGPDTWATFMASSNMAALSPMGVAGYGGEYFNVGSPGWDRNRRTPVALMSPR